MSRATEAVGLVAVGVGLVLTGAALQDRATPPCTCPEPVVGVYEVPEPHFVTGDFGWSCWVNPNWRKEPTP